MIVRAVAVVCIPGFRTLLRGEVCEVPWANRFDVQQLVDRGQAELVAAPAVAASPAPPTLETTSEVVPAGDAEETALRLELEALEAQAFEQDEIPTAVESPAPKRTEIVCRHCGKAYSQHSKKPSQAVEGVECKGLRKNVVAT